jgi:hypothetical protein
LEGTNCFARRIYYERSMDVGDTQTWLEISVS